MRASLRVFPTLTALLCAITLCAVPATREAAASSTLPVIPSLAQPLESLPDETDTAIYREYADRFLRESHRLFSSAASKRLAREGYDLLHDAAGEAGGEEADALRLHAVDLFFSAYEREWNAPYAYLAPALVLLSVRGGAHAEEAHAIGLRLADAIEQRAVHMPKAPEYGPFYWQPPANLDDHVGVLTCSALRVSALPSLRGERSAMLQAFLGAAQAEELNQADYPRQYVPSPLFDRPRIPARKVNSWGDKSEAASFGELGEWLVRAHINGPRYYDAVTDLIAEQFASEREVTMRSCMVFRNFSNACWNYRHAVRRPIAELFETVFHKTRRARERENGDSTAWYAGFLSAIAAHANNPTRITTLTACLLREGMQLPPHEAPRVYDAAFRAFSRFAAFSGLILPPLEQQNSEDYLVLPDMFDAILPSMKRSPALWQALAELRFAILQQGRFENRQAYEAAQRSVLDAAAAGLALEPESVALHYITGLALLKDADTIVRFSEAPIESQAREALFDRFWKSYERVVRSEARLPPGTSLSAPLQVPLDRGWLPAEKGADAFLLAVEKEESGGKDEFTPPSNSSRFFAYVRLALASAAPEKRARFLELALDMESRPSPLSEGESAGEWDYYRGQSIMSRALVRRAGQEPDADRGMAFFAESREYNAWYDHVPWCLHLFDVVEQCELGQGMEPCAPGESARLYGALAAECESLKTREEIFPKYMKRPSGLPGVRTVAVLDTLAAYAAAERDVYDKTGTDDRRAILLRFREMLLAPVDQQKRLTSCGGGVKAMEAITENSVDDAEAPLMRFVTLRLARLAVRSGNADDAGLFLQEALEFDERGMAWLRSDRELAPVRMRLDIPQTREEEEEDR